MPLATAATSGDASGRRRIAGVVAAEPVGGAATGGGAETTGADAALGTPVGEMGGTTAGLGGVAEGGEAAGGVAAGNAAAAGGPACTVASYPRRARTMTSGRRTFTSILRYEPSNRSSGLYPMT